MDPLTWVYLALLAAGTAAQDQAVKKVDRETTKAQVENRNLRADREKQSQQLAQESQQAVLDTKAKQAQRAQELAAQYQTPSNAVDATGKQVASGELDPVLSGASQSTIDNANRAAAKSKADLDRTAQMRGQMDAYGSVFQDATNTLQQNSADVRRNEKSMNDWTNYVLPMKLAAANQSGRQWSTTGDLLKLAGMVVGGAALADPSKAATAAPTTESTNIGQSIQAAKTPWLDATQPAMQGGSIPFGSSYGVADAEAGYLQSLGMDVPEAMGARALASPAAARMYQPMASAFAPSQLGPVAPATTGGWLDQFNQPWWLKRMQQMKRPNYVMR
jgi:hypothetical protein